MTGRIWKLAALSTMMNREFTEQTQCVLRGKGGARAPRPFSLKGDILSHRWAAGLKICTHVTCDGGLRSQALLLCSGHRAMGKGKGVNFLGEVNCFKFVIVHLRVERAQVRASPTSSPSRGRNGSVSSQQPMWREQPTDCGSKPPPPGSSSLPVLVQ